jgi:hypothetical protein
MVRRTMNRETREGRAPVTEEMGIRKKPFIEERHMANYPQTTTSSFTGDITITNGGKAGIGTTSPAVELDIKGNGIIRGNSWQGSGDTATLGFGDGLHYLRAVWGQGVRIGTYQADDAIAIKETSGNVGIGTTSPIEKLDVNGGVKVGYTGGSAAGTIRWNSSTLKLQVHTGSTWVNLH